MSKKFKKGDNVIVISGSNKEKVGVIIEVKDEMVAVSGVAIRKFHRKPSNNKKGFIENKESLIHISNISHYSKNDNKPFKVGFMFQEANDAGVISKERICKKTKQKL